MFWTIYFLVERDTLLKEQHSIASWGVSHSSLVSTRLRPMSVKTNTNQLFVIRPESHLLCKRTAQQRQNIKSTYLKKRFFLHILKHKILHEKDFLSPNFSIWIFFLGKMNMNCRKYLKKKFQKISKKISKNLDFFFFFNPFRFTSRWPNTSLLTRITPKGGYLLLPTTHGAISPL